MRSKNADPEKNLARSQDAVSEPSCEPERAVHYFIRSEHDRIVPVNPAFYAKLSEYLLPLERWHTPQPVSEKYGRALVLWTICSDGDSAAILFVPDKDVA